MKRTIFATVMVAISSLLWAGLAVGSGTSAHEGHMGSTATGGMTQQTAAQPLDMNQIHELQRLLNDQGYNSGVPDGVIGPNTTAAIRQFQLDNNLTNSGEPDEDTLRRLSPDTEKQEFFGLAPEYGEQEGMMETESEEMKDDSMMKMMKDKAMEKMPKKMDY